MSYQMEIDREIYHLEGDVFTSELTEKRSSINKDEFSMSLTDVSFSNFHLIWGNHRASSPNILSIKFETPSILSHFCLSDSSVSTSKRVHSCPAKKCVVYLQKAKTYEHEVDITTKESGYTFFELALSTSFFEKFFTTESTFLQSFFNQLYTKSATETTPYQLYTSPAMLALINEMSNNKYKGHLKGLYLEAKVIELFLLQINQLDQNIDINSSNLKPKDIECLHEAKYYIEQNFHTPCSIIDLARKVGINQMKLKNGFKKLFGTTVFGYVSDLKMEKAKQLILDEKLYIGEVSDRIGYKHPHHFSAAFKRKYGLLPSDLKG
jgi:AraC-like DNA-binding protein